MDLPRIWTGLPAKPRPPEAAGARAARALAALLATCVAGAAAAETKLLPPERAFAYSVQALDDRSIEARFTIADGYYMYREKMGFTVEPGGLAASPSLPPGKVKDDEFFGKVQTYRGRVVVKLSLDKPAPGQKITVRAQSQGCADAGVCYPPQVQDLTVALPAPGARPGPPVEAAPARKSWFN